LGAGFILWQTQRTLEDEIRWAREAEAAINAYATAEHGEQEVEFSPVSLAEQGQLQRVRIPALGIDFQLRPEATALTSATRGEKVEHILFLILPVEIYGDAVCGLKQLQPGDSVYLETMQQAFAYRVDGTGSGGAAGASGDGTLVVLSGYPCGDEGKQVLVSAIGEAR
jgi:hypothetical protein